MKKRLNFIISLLLILSICVGTLSFDAFSFENNVETSSNEIMLINADTSTVVFSRNATKKWYCSYLSTLMTFVVAAQNSKDYDKTKVNITADLLERIPSSDGKLKQFEGKTLTIRDLMVLMFMTTGNDAAYVLADFVSHSDIDAFVRTMNQKASELGMKDTKYFSPAFDEEMKSLTTCADLYKLYRYALDIELFKEVSSYSSYIPKGYAEKEALDTEVSIKSSSSPYYFKYTDTAKYSYDKKSGAGMLATTVYRGSTYIFIAMHGMKEAERNVYVDCKQLTTWAYLNLSDKKIVGAEDVDVEVSVESPWRKDSVSLTVGGSSYRTMPNEYDVNKFMVEYDVPDSVKLPVFEGQSIGTAKIIYDSQRLDEISLTSTDTKGVEMLSDIREFLNSAYRSVLSVEPEEEPVSE